MSDNKRKPSQKPLKDIKEKIEDASAYFKPNYDRYHEYMRFVFKSSMTQEQEESLKELGMPALEFNILESGISRLRGEFAKQQPSLKVRASDGVPIHLLGDKFDKTIKVVESHLRAIFFDASNDKEQYNIYSDLLAGGFSVWEVYTDYVNDMSMEQNISANRVFDPTLCGFDPLARDSHKGDGRFCFQVYPKTKKEFEQEYGKKRADSMKYSGNSVGAFSWSYRGKKDDTVLICDFYEKKRKKAKILKLSNGHTVLEKEYKKFLEEWDMSGVVEQAPVIVIERQTTLETIVRYRVCENEILDYSETNYRHLPLVFVDGNSVFITEGEEQYQMTRPSVYHAKGIQQLKNFAGQSLCRELQNTVAHKYLVALESIPKDYLDAYTKPQVPNTLIYKHILDSDPTKTLPPPQPIHRTPIPPEITSTFRMSDEMTQVILGSYDSALGANRQEISGAAIALGAMQSNNASVPYVVGYIKGLNRVAQIIVDLIPKYYRTPRSLPVLLPDGKRDYQIINQANPEGEDHEGEAVYMNYDPNTLQVKVETGVNFAMQKELALKTLISLMGASPKFAEFMNDEGLNALLDNIDIRGIDSLKSKAVEYEKAAKQKKGESSQMQQKVMEMQLQLNAQKAQADALKAKAEAAKAMKEVQGPSKADIELKKLQQDAEFKDIQVQQAQEKIDMELAKLLAALQNEDKDRAIDIAKIDAEQARTSVETLHNLLQARKTAAEMGISLGEGSGNISLPENNLPSQDIEPNI